MTSPDYTISIFKFKELSAPVCVRITFDEMESSFARFNDRRGLAVEVECDSAVRIGNR